MSGLFQLLGRRDKRKNEEGDVLVTRTPMIGAPFVTGVQMPEFRLVEVSRR